MHLLAMNLTWVPQPFHLCSLLPEVESNQLADVIHLILGLATLCRVSTVDCSLLGELGGASLFLVLQFFRCGVWCHYARRRRPIETLQYSADALHGISHTGNAYNDNRTICVSSGVHWGSRRDVRPSTSRNYTSWRYSFWVNTRRRTTFQTMQDEDYCNHNVFLYACVTGGNYEGLQEVETPAKTGRVCECTCRPVDRLDLPCRDGGGEEV